MNAKKSLLNNYLYITVMEFINNLHLKLQFSFSGCVNSMIVNIFFKTVELVCVLYEAKLANLVFRLSGYLK